MRWDGFFSDEPGAITQALSSLTLELTAISQGEVKSPAIYSHAGSFDRAGVASEPIFGAEPSERERRWGHILLGAPCLHPLLVPLVAELLGTRPEVVFAVARGEAWWHAGEIFLPPESQPRLEPGIPIWEWEPGAVEELDPGLKELYRINTQLRRLGSLPRWAEAHFGTEAAWFDEALGGTGPSGLRAALGAVTGERLAAFEQRFGIAPRWLVTELLPVPPPGQRPFVSRPGGFQHPGPTNAAFAHLLFLNEVFAQTLKYEGQGLTARGIERSLQLAFEEVIYRMVGPLPKWLQPEIVHEVEVETDGEPPQVEELPNQEYIDEPDRSFLRQSVALVFAGDGDSALLQLPSSTFPLRLTNGSVDEPTITAGLQLLHLDPHASHAVFVDPSRVGLHVLELAARRWCHDRPEVFSPNLLRATKRWSGRGLVVSACGRFYMETIYVPHSMYGSDGWVVRSLDGEPVFEPGGERADDPLAWLSEAGTLRVFDDPHVAEYACRPDTGTSAEALVLADSGEFLTLVDNVLVRGRTSVCGFAFEIQAAAFDPTGTRLLLAGSKALTLLDVQPEQPRVLGSFGLLPLLDQMATTRWRGSTRALASALCRFGSLPKLAERDISELAELTMLDASRELRPIGTAEATRISRMARGVRTRSQPLRLPFTEPR